MTSAPSNTAEGLYQTQCIRNRQLDNDAVYADLSPVQAAKVQLRRAYVIAVVLIAISLVTAVIPAVYVASTTAFRFDSGGSGDGNWTICRPCSNSSSGTCCATLAKTDLRCSTITAVLFNCRC